ncbi:unnamed protein product [Peniophora sp. CBMAI 1063]|nr:unnamed protein product [Peniophora sp. CBMAI 1063]
MFAKTAAFAALAALAGSAVAQKCTRTYAVQEGDWCDTISASQNASTYQLSTVNPTINDLCANLEIGWNLCLGLEGSDCQTTYVVEPNDTIESIAEKYSTNSSTVLANNPQLEKDSSNLYIGEVLALCGNVTVPEATSTSPTAAVPAHAETAGDDDC